MSSLKLIAALIVAIVLVVFGAQNTQAVTFHFLMFKAPSTPMVLALFLAALLGALLGWIVSAPGRFRSMRERRDLQGQVAAHQQEAVAATDMEQTQPL
ncbi:MAG: lipopolysaccharide assembly protein LapA domain-containing protein [Chloroflexota bacterium]|nr:lipopolysaccharide assembly protein LapA domain-containing protein [Chloroflexota bacterium]